MPKFKLEIVSENEAFRNGDTEVVRLLRDAANKVERGYRDGRLMDVNGNTVGEFKFTERERG
ncbi:MAG: hypothetical protein Q7T05_02300 [Dehalococcoidia bacterium]|nr:hypothetical protein [Dehalococcoidia bacterium]